MKVKYYFSILIGLLLFAGCTSPKSTSNKNSEQDPNLPELIVFPKIGTLIDTNAQLESRSYPFYRIKKKGDSITFANPTESYNPKPENTEIFTIIWNPEHRKNGGLELYVDTEQTFASKSLETFTTSTFVVEVDANGNEINKKPYQPPYDKVMKYPAYIFNTSDVANAIENHDGRLIFVQEALTKDNTWKAIEYFEYSGCGNSSGIIPLEPKGLVMFGVNKYSGDFKTKLRIRLKTFGKIIVSSEFDGFINLEQLEASEENTTLSYDRYLNIKR